MNDNKHGQYNNSDNINMDSTTAESVNDNINMDSTITGSVVT